MRDAFITCCRGEGTYDRDNSPPVFSYTGQHEVLYEANYGWQIKFLSSGTFTFSKLGNAAGGIDLFLMGGGGSGGYGDLFYAGGGGKQGTAKTIRGIIPQIQTEYIIEIGEGGTHSTPSGDSSAFGYVAEGGANGANGTSAGVKGQNSTVREFDSENGQPLGGNGGNGGGSTADFILIDPGAGGEPFGGAGGSYGNSYTTPGHGTAAAANTGAGGGGGGGCTYSASTHGANGGSGIVIIRNAR